MNLYFIPLFISAFLILSLGFVIYSKNKGKILNRTFSLICLVSGIWLLCYAFAYVILNKKLALILFKLGYCGVVFIPIASFHFFTEFFRTNRFKFFVYVSYLIGLIFIVLIWLTPYLVKDIHKYFWGYYPLAGKLHFCFFLFFSFLILFSFLLFFYFGWFRKTKISPLINVQSKYLFIALCVYNFAIVDFLPNYKIEVYPFGYLPAFLFVVIISFAIIRYRLMDISIAITRTGIFIAVYSLVLGTPFIIAYSLQPYLIGFMGDNWWLAPMGLLTVLATVGPFVYIFINRKAEDRLLHEQRQYQQTLRQASSGMIRVRELQKLLNLIVHVVARTVRLEFAAVFLHDSDNCHYSLAAKRGKAKFATGYTLKDNSFLVRHLIEHPEPLVFEEIQLRSQDNPTDSHLAGLEKDLSSLSAAVVVPSFVGKQLLGCLVLGKKLSGKLYSQDDLNVFSVLANQSALAIENAQFYEDIKETQEQLFQAEKMATIGTMADGLSHQINNRFQALSLIAGDSMDILKTIDVSQCSQEVKDSFMQLQHAFARILTNVMQGGDVVRGLLRYSRPGQEGFDAVMFNRVIDGALEMVQYKIRISEIDIKRNIPEGLPNIRCNLTQLEEVFFNLVDNAYDAIKEKQSILKDPAYRGVIEISAFQEDTKVRIVFQDNGAGVTDKDKEKLFTPFFTTKASNHRGTGLGLYVIQKIVSHHNGTVLMDSTHMQGTKFEIVLPASQ